MVCLSFGMDVSKGSFLFKFCFRAWFREGRQLRSSFSVLCVMWFLI